MDRPDLNMLFTLDALLREGSVAGAARRLQLSPSAMSRALARVREAIGDPLLVRAGRRLVPTPRALQLREDVAALVGAAEAALAPAAPLDIGALERTFTLRNREGFVETFGAAIVARAAREAPRVRLRFVPKPDRASGPLRDAEVDLETGVVAENTGPELRSQALFRDRLVGVVRMGHPLCNGEVTAERYAALGHIQVSRRGLEAGPVDEALRNLGLERRIAAVVSAFPEAVALARGTELIATVPDVHVGPRTDDTVSFRLPFALPELTISLMWHPRLDADAGHQWLRTCAREACAQVIAGRRISTRGAARRKESR